MEFLETKNVLVDEWKIHRKIINRSFNVKVVESFLEIILKQTRVFVADIETFSTEIKDNAYPKIFECSFKTVFGKKHVVLETIIVYKY